MAATTEQLVDREAQAARDENKRLLRSCSAHFFDCSALDWRSKTTPTALRCVMCRGWMAFERACGYAEGVGHYGGDPDAVIEGFSR